MSSRDDLSEQRNGRREAHSLKLLTEKKKLWIFSCNSPSVCFLNQPFTGASPALYHPAAFLIFTVDFCFLSLTAGSDYLYLFSGVTFFYMCAVFVCFFFGFFANNCTCRKMKDPIVSIRALWITAENQRLLSLIIVFPQLCPHLLTLLSSSSNNANSHSRHRGPAQLPQHQS